jgi:pimeloyl-ACP methyl ester carboxylesterase
MPSAAGLYYFACEEENITRPPVILIHGAGGTNLFWPPQVRRLPNQRILAVDLPGHGRSEGVGHQLIADYAENIREFMGALNLRAAVMIGHSMGSAVALSLAIDFPQRVIGLGLLGSGARMRVAPRILDSAANPASFQNAIQLVTENSYAASTEPWLKELASRRMAETRPTILHGDFLACNAFSVADQLARISAPTLILCGAEDRMTPLKLAESLRDQIGGARLEVIPQAGHMVMLERPGLVAESLMRFLDQIPYRPGQ